MGVWEKVIVKKEMPLVRFNNSITYALGTIKLIVMVKGYVVMVNFVVVDAPAHYNQTLCRSWIHKMRAVPFTYHQVIKYPTEGGIMDVRGDQKKAHKCYNVAMKQAEPK